MTFKFREMQRYPHDLHDLYDWLLQIWKEKVACLKPPLTLTQVLEKVNISWKFRRSNWTVQCEKCWCYPSFFYSSPTNVKTTDPVPFRPFNTLFSDLHQTQNIKLGDFITYCSGRPASHFPATLSLFQKISFHYRVQKVCRLKWKVWNKFLLIFSNLLVLQHKVEDEAPEGGEVNVKLSIGGRVGDQEDHD